MLKHSPNSKSMEIEDINVNSVDSLHSDGHFVSGRHTSVAGSECNDDKSIDACSSDDESHELENTEQENQSTFAHGQNHEHLKAAVKKKKKKSGKVKFAGNQDDKTGIKLKIRRTNNYNQDENHMIVDNAEQQRKRHLKNKRCKSLSHDESIKVKLEEVTKNVGSDDNLSNKRCKTDSDDESKVSIGINTISKGTNVDESCLGLCQAGTRLSLESVVMMETKSGILIVSVQWRGKTLMGALMESDRFQIGSIEKDSIYRRDKLSSISRRNTRRKSKNIYGKKKRKLTTPTDSGEHAGTENEAGNSDGDNPYCCDKESCHMKFADFQTLRIHIYQKHRVKGESGRPASLPLCSSPALLTMHLAPHTTSPKPSIPDLVRTDHTTNGPATIQSFSDERNTFSPAYSDISDANDAPVLENEAELKPASVSVAQPPINLSLCQNPALLAASKRMLFSPSAPALQPEVSICSSQPPNLRLPPHHHGKLPHIANYRFPLAADNNIMNGFLPALSSTNHKPPNGALTLSSASNIPVTDMNLNSIQDLSLNGSRNLTNYQKLSHKLAESNNHHKTANNLMNCHKAPSSTATQSSRHQSHMHSNPQHHNPHSNNTNLSNGVVTSNHNSKHSLTSENGVLSQQPPNGVPMSHTFPYVSFSQSVNNQSNKYNFPINQVYNQSLYNQPKF